MKKFSKKGLLLFVGAMAVCAFVLPAVSSAASWGVVGSHHTLTSPDIGFTSTTAGNLTGSCTNSSFTTTVTNATVLTITTGSFAGCTSTAPNIGGGGVGADCLTTWVPTNFPWTATAVTTNNIQFHGLRVDWRFEDMPGRPGSCIGLNGASTLLTGTVTGGVWTGNGANQHEVIFTNAPGLNSHPGNTPVTWRGTLRDNEQTLTVLPFP
jgi:hypothetical protein